MKILTTCVLILVRIQKYNAFRKYFHSKFFTAVVVSRILHRCRKSTTYKLLTPILK